MKRETNDWLNIYMEYTENTEPSKNYRFWVGISTICSLLKRKCFLRWGTLTFYPNMYIILVGPPASKKGTAISYGSNLLYEMGFPVSPDAITKESLIREVKNSYEVNNYKENNKEKEMHHCSYTIISPEISVLFNDSRNLEMIKMLTDWFDCGKSSDGVWSYQTLSRGIDKIMGLYVNILGATTPEQLALYPQILSIGLASRLILVYEQNKSKSVPFPELTKEQIKLKKILLNDLYKINDMSGVFKYTDAFKDFYITWYESNDKRKNDYLNDKYLVKVRNKTLDQYYDRRPVHLLKLCMVLCASRTNSMILDEEDIIRASNVLRETEKKMHLAYGAYGEDPRTKILYRIKNDIQDLNGIISFLDLYKNYFSDVPVLSEFRGLINGLQTIKVLKLFERNGQEYIKPLIKREKNESIL